MGTEMNLGPSASGWSEWLGEALDNWEQAGLLRTLKPISSESAVHVSVEDKSLVLFSSNDYLGLSHHPKVREAVSEAVTKKGMGPRGSALVCGYTSDHCHLEQRLAKLKNAESALLFPTGYAANLCALSSLADPETAIFSDELNHASLIDGCRMAKQNGSTVHVYPHRDLKSLRLLLESCDRPKRLIVTDSVFSMDGDLAPLRELVALKEEFGAWLMVDEAHGSLVFGETGSGVCERAGVSSRVEIQMGTLSKAIGSQGGYIASTERLKTWFLNRGRAYVFSTALPIPSVVAALAAIDVSREEPEIRERLWRWIELIEKRLGRRLESPIVPIVIGGNTETLALSQALWDHGFHVPGIRPPTVPKGTARLRIAVSAAHQAKDIEDLFSCLNTLAANFNLSSFEAGSEGK